MAFAHRCNTGTAFLCKSGHLPLREEWYPRAHWIKCKFHHIFLLSHFLFLLFGISMGWQKSKNWMISRICHHCMSFGAGIPSGRRHGCQKVLSAKKDTASFLTVPSFRLIRLPDLLLFLSFLQKLDRNWNNPLPHLRSCCSFCWNP